MVRLPFRNVPCKTRSTAALQLRKAMATVRSSVKSVIHLASCSSLSRAPSGAVLFDAIPGKDGIGGISPTIDILLTTRSDGYQRIGCTPMRLKRQTHIFSIPKTTTPLVLALALLATTNRVFFCRHFESGEERLLVSALVTTVNEIFASSSYPKGTVYI